MAILTLSSQYGSDGRPVGRLVAARLGYSYVDKERILTDIRADGARWEEWGRDLDDHCPTVWEKNDWSFRGFAALVQSHVLRYAADDDVVIMGRGANFLLKGIDHCLRVRIVAALPVRVERIMKREGVNRETAAWLCDKTDSERACFIHAIYGQSWDDAAHYDEVFANDTDAAADGIVVGLLAQLAGKGRQAGPESKRRVALLAAAARLKAGIATDPSFFLPLFDVEPDGDGLVLRGVTHSPAEHHRLEAAARVLAGNLPLRCELHYRNT